MKKRNRLGFAFIASLSLCATSVSAQANPAAVAQGLRSTDRSEQLGALRALRGVAPEDTAPAVRQALIEATMRENRAGAERMERIRTGTTRPSDDLESGLLSVLIDLLVPLQDSETIPALLGMFEAGVGGLMLNQALAEFGEPAAPQILDAVMSPASNLWLVSGGLGSLRLMVELSPGLSAATIESITLAAERYLTVSVSSNYLVLVGAIDLAAVLSDPRLDEVLRPLVADPALVRAMGIESSRRIERVQERAQRALDRVPPLPRPR